MRHPEFPVFIFSVSAHPGVFALIKVNKSWVNENVTNVHRNLKSYHIIKPFTSPRNGFRPVISSRISNPWHYLEWSKKQLSIRSNEVSNSDIQLASPKWAPALMILGDVLSTDADSTPSPPVRAWYLALLSIIHKRVYVNQNLVHQGKCLVNKKDSTVIK